jgi:hypothetical protein
MNVSFPQLQGFAGKEWWVRVNITRSGVNAPAEFMALSFCSCAKVGCRCALCGIVDGFAVRIQDGSFRIDCRWLLRLPLSNRV